MSAVARIATMFVVAFDSYWRYNENILDSNAPDYKTESNPVTGLILARAGSKGIPHKNMAILNGHPLIHWALEAMLQSGVFHTIWVSTDDPAVKKYLTDKYPGVFIHDRAEYTATDEATSISAVQEFIKSHPEINTDAFCLVQATSPLIHSKYLIEGFKLISSKNHDYDSVFSVSRQFRLRWSDVSKHNSKGFTKALNFNPNDRPRRQDWSGELVENGMFYFTKRELLLRGSFQGERAFYIEIPKDLSLEIDSPEDLIYAGLIMSRETIYENSILSENTEDSVHRIEL